MKKNKATLLLYPALATRVFSLILAISLFLFCPITALADWYGDDENDHGNVSYAELQYSAYDKTNLVAALQEMEALCQGAGNDSALLENYQIMTQEFDKMITQKSINKLRYYGDVNNEEYQTIDATLSRTLTDLADRAGHTMHLVLTSDYYQLIADQIKYPDIIDYYLDYTDMTEEQKELAAEDTDLIQQYDRAQSQKYTYTDSDGKVWTEASLTSDPSIYETEGKYEEVSEGIAKAKNDAIASIFIAMVKNRNRQAQLKGYKNYAEYAYQDIYNRDYSTTDVEKVHAAVKKYFVPIIPVIFKNTVSLTDVSLLNMPDLNEDTIVEEVGKHIGKIDPELNKAYDHMRRLHLYDMKSSPTRMDVGYTDYLYEYKEPVIFNCPDQTYYDYETLIHEFGHYNNAYHNSETSFTDPINMDVAEIHSQGLELLYFPYADELFKGLGDSVRLLNLYNIASSVVEGCLYDEFQIAVYTSEKELSAEEINEIFFTLAGEYGYADDYANTRRYSWINVSHTFQSPLYYISYATSALSALDIFCSSLDDRQNAIDRYMSLTTYGLGTPYCELIRTVGLRDIFEEETIRNIAADTVNYSRDITKHAASAESYKFLVKAMIVLVLVVAVIAVIVIMVDKWLKKRSSGEGGPDVG